MRGHKGVPLCICIVMFTYYSYIVVSSSVMYLFSYSYLCSTFFTEWKFWTRVPGISQEKADKCFSQTVDGRLLGSIDAQQKVLGWLVACFKTITPSHLAVLAPVQPAVLRASPVGRRGTSARSQGRRLCSWKRAKFLNENAFSRRNIRYGKTRLRSKICPSLPISCQTFGGLVLGRIENDFCE